jgi:hypothetical protein
MGEEFCPCCCGDGMVVTTDQSIILLNCVHRLRDEVEEVKGGTSFASSNELSNKESELR